MKKAKITAKGDFSQPSSKHHSFAEVFLISIIINLMWGERQDFGINKPAKLGENAVSRESFFGWRGAICNMGLRGHFQIFDLNLGKPV